jgi:hypothetical protein
VTCITKPAGIRGSVWLEEVGRKTENEEMKVETEEHYYDYL